MAWVMPKTDWSGAYDTTGKYVGDYFNATDFNRIKNNIEHLRDMAIQIYEEFDIPSLGEDRTPVDYFYADEINQMDENLRTVIQKSVNIPYGFSPFHVPNGNTMTAEELNRLERTILEVYEGLSNILNERRTFAWNFGMKGGVL